MRITFISTMTGYAWAASEELWSRAARRLAEGGNTVAATVADHDPLSNRLASVVASGVRLTVRRAPRGQLLRALWRRVGGRAGEAMEKRWLRRRSPELVIISQGGTMDGLAWMQACHGLGLPYIAIVHAVADHFWLNDSLSQNLADAYRGAVRVGCVSRHNLRVLEWHLGEALPNAQIIHSPHNAQLLDPSPWPKEDGVARLACVARLEPGAKGQDVLLQVLAQPAWRVRPVELNLYGAGDSEKVLRKLVKRLELPNVNFRGHVGGVAGIWQANHLLVLPSRYEGLPLTLIEAMCCGRPAVVTDVGGNAELCVEGETGFIAAAPAVGPLAEAMERAWARRADWPKLGAAARQRVQQLIPSDPVNEFCELVAKCVEEVKTSPRQN